MAAPNLVNIASIVGGNAKLALTTSPQSLVANAGGSGTLVKVDSVIVSNIDGVNSVNVSLYVDEGANNRYLAYLIPVPGGTTQILLDRSVALHLLEGEELFILASAASDAEVTANFWTLG